MSKYLTRSLFGFAILFFSLLSYAQDDTEVVEFPEEELASETVLPVFDVLEVVKNRTVVQSEHFEVGLGMGFNLTEALYNNQNFNLSMTYYLNENHGINILAAFVTGGLSDKGKDLQDGKGLRGNSNFDPELIPSPETYLLGHYQFNAYYGKISFSKQTVYNLSLYGLVGGGMVTYSDTSAFGVSVGFGQKLFFTPRFALRADLGLLTYSGPDPTTAPQNNSEELKSSEVDETTYFHTLLTVGLVYLL